MLLRTHTSPVQVRTMETQRAADLRRRARARVPQRHARRAPLAGVPPDRGPRRRPRASRSATCSARSRRSSTRSFGADIDAPASSVVLPVHRAVGRVRDVVRLLRRRRLHACVRAPAGSSSAAAGMVDPNVFEAVGIDPEEYTGFAFGFGIDRVASSCYGIDHIKNLLGRRRALRPLSSEARPCARRCHGFVSSRRLDASVAEHRRRAEPARARGRGDRRARAARSTACVVARILDVVPHPDADRIRLADVDFGDGQTARRVRRAEHRSRHGRAVRAGRRGPARRLQDRAPQDPRRGLGGDAVLGARARPRRRPRRHPRAARRRRARHRRARGARPRRRRVRPRDHAEPSRRDGHRRRRARARRALRPAVRRAEAHDAAPIVDERGRGATVVVEAPDRCPRFVAVRRAGHDGRVARRGCSAGSCSPGCGRSATSSTSPTT